MKEGERRGGEAVESSKGEEGGRGVVAECFAFNYTLLSYQGRSHTPKLCFVHLSPPAGLGAVPSSC